LLLALSINPRHAEVACHDRVVEWATDEAHREVPAAKRHL
jgi:predicted component of type VI protein secretion system